MGHAMKRWNLEETYNLVNKAFGQEQMRLAKSSTQSVLDRQEFARYHYREIVRLSKMLNGLT